MFAFVAHHTDALIYVFKSLIRLTKALGRLCFNIEFKEDVEHYTKRQTLLDLLALSLFIATIVFLTAIATPIAPTIAWIMAWVGLGIIGYSDYYLSTMTIKHELEQQQAHIVDLTQQYLDEENTEKWLENSAAIKKEIQTFIQFYKDYATKNTAFKLYSFMILGIGALLICSSAALFTSGLTSILLMGIAQGASVLLGGIALLRLRNWYFSKSESTTGAPEEKYLELLEAHKGNGKDAATIFNAFSEDQGFKLLQKPKTRIIQNHLFASSDLESPVGPDDNHALYLQLA